MKRVKAVVLLMCEMNKLGYSDFMHIKFDSKQHIVSSCCPNQCDGCMKTGGGTVF